MINTFFTIVGYLIILALSLAAFLAALGVLAERLNWLHRCLMFKAEVAARQELGARISRDSYWFSESGEAMSALALLGKKVREHHDGYYEISSLRDEWRNRQPKQKVEAKNDINSI